MSLVCDGCGRQAPPNCFLTLNCQHHICGACFGVAFNSILPKCPCIDCNADNISSFRSDSQGAQCVSNIDLRRTLEPVFNKTCTLGVLQVVEHSEDTRFVSAASLSTASSEDDKKIILQTVATIADQILSAPEDSPPVRLCSRLRSTLI